MKKVKKIPVFARCVFIITALFAVCHTLFYIYPDFADFWNSSAGYVSRMLFSKFFGIFPFSFMELLLLTSPALIALTAYIIYRYSSKGKIYLIRSVSVVLACICIIYCMFVTNFASGYRGRDLSEKIGLSKRDVSANELFYTALILADEVNGFSQKVNFAKNGASVLPMSYNELSDELNSAYGNLCKSYDFCNDYSSRVKTLVISKYMTYTHLSGIYSFFTGEANINTNYPDYVVAFSAAHEMAHQRGISKENEANFTAFLVCINSGNDYLRYSGYLQMFNYVIDALYSADKTLYYEVCGRINDSVRGELSAYSIFFDEYRDNTAAKVSNTLNEAYLKSQGTEGVKSYGLVVDLAVAYYID